MGVFSVVVCYFRICILYLCIQHTQLSESYLDSFIGFMFVHLIMLAEDLLQENMSMPRGFLQRISPEVCKDYSKL